MTTILPPNISQETLAGWFLLRERVEAADWVLNDPIFEAARLIFQRYYSESDATLADLNREYQSDEFLLVLDAQGSGASLSTRVFDEYARTVEAAPAFARWFRVDRPVNSRPVLLAARWLSHLVGFRHGTVEIFIDPPDLPGYSLVQVRGMDKFEAPGAFDIPCAGHISGVDRAEASLYKELAEELNLTFDDLVDPRMLGQYNSYAPKNQRIANDIRAVNNEYRYLYRAGLKRNSANRIRFTDGEVAGLAVFAVSELRELVQRFPERVASGLSGALGYYK